jgi:hypothetical protein
MLQAGVLKYCVLGKEEVGKCGIRLLAGKEDGGVDGHLLEKPSGLGSFVCCFPLALLSIFILFHCFLAFQHLTL